MDGHSLVRSQAYTTYSTITSQAVLTLGGSSITCVLSSMFAEAFPFLRSIASKIHNNLGFNHPHVLPAAMVAFAMSSVALGLTLSLLAVLRRDDLVGYFS